MLTKSSHTMAHYRIHRAGFLILMWACVDHNASVSRHNEPAQYQAIANPPSKNALDVKQGYARALDAKAMSTVREPCTSDVVPSLAYDVFLDDKNRVGSVRVSSSTGSSACDEAISIVLRKSSWQTCTQNERPIACKVSGVFALPHRVHRKAPSH